MTRHGASHYRKPQKNVLLVLSSVTLMVVVTTMISATGKGPHQAGKESLSVSDPRPVMLATEKLEEKYGWIITYEDPPWGESELLDVTEKVRRDFHTYKPGQAPTVLVPKGGELAFEYDIEPSTKKPVDAAVVAQQLLDAYAIAFNPGVFRLDRDGQRLHIIGIASKDEAGALVSRHPVLDAAITIPAKKRAGAEILKAFCAAVSAANHVPVMLGSAPWNLLHPYQTESGANNQKARDFLNNELDRMMRRNYELDRMTGQPRLSWDLRYAADRKAYYLNFHLVYVGQRPI